MKQNRVGIYIIRVHLMQTKQCKGNVRILVNRVHAIPINQF